MYSKWRFRIIVLQLGVFGIFVVTALMRGQFPLAFGAELCLIPCLLRELDRRKGLAPRRLGSLEWSYIVGGLCWVFASPLAG
jgi:hypothetical protein